MLQFIRSKAGSFVVKLLFAALIACFGIWGIGDFLRQSSTGTTVLTVGSTKVSAEEVHDAIDREADRMKQMFGGTTTLSHDQLKQMGVVDRAVQGEADRAAFDEEAKRLGLAVGDPEIAISIAQDQTFRGANGLFSKDIFNQLLAANHITEAQYVALIRTGIPRQQLAQLALSNASAPLVMTKLLYAQRAEKRVADYVFVPADRAGPVPTPTPAQLQDYYKKNPATFTAPEYRGFTALALSEADVINTISVSDAQLQDLYQQRQGDFALAEQRNVQNLTVPDEATAKKVEAALASGQDFLAVAKSLGNQGPDTVNLGWITHQDLPPPLVDIAFAAKQNVPSQPIKTDFGWSILRVTDIRPAHVLSFEQAKPQLLIDARQDAAGDALYALSNKVEDAIAGGADLAGIAKQFDLKPFSVKAADQNGLDVAGKPVAGLPVDTADLVKTAFATSAGQMSQLQQTKDGKFYLVRDDTVTPPALKPFDAVKDQVQADWSAAENATLMTAFTAKLQKDAGAAKSFAGFAGSYGATVETTQPFARDADPATTPLPPALTQQIFSQKQGGIAAAEGQNAGANGVFVARLASIQPGDVTDKAAVDGMRQQISSDIGNELVSEFSQNLRQRYPVQVNQQLLDQLY